MRLAAALAALAVAAGACGPPSIGVAVAPALQRVQVEQMAFRADDLERAAMAGAGAAGLQSGFRGAARTTLEAMSEHLSRRGMRIEERDIARKLVFFDARALEAVLAVIARRRLVTPDDVEPVWVATARQWWLRFAYQSGAWWVVDQQDLPPDRWFTTS